MTSVPPTTGTGTAGAPAVDLESNVEGASSGSEPNRPTLTHQKSKYEYSLKLIARHDVQAAYALHDAKMLNLADGMKIFDLLDRHKTNALTHEEVMVGCVSNKTVNEYIVKYEDTALGLLQDPAELGKLLKSIDLDNDRLLSRREWKEFLAVLVETDIEFLKRKGLSAMRCYWGRGLDGDDNIGTEHGGTAFGTGSVKVSSRTPKETVVSSDPSAPPPPAGPSPLQLCCAGFVAALSSCLVGYVAIPLNDALVSYGLVEKGWLEDWWFYERNSHPILALFLAEEDHPLSSWARLNIEFCCQSYGLMMSAALFNTNLVVFVYPLFVAVPVVCLRAILSMLYKCPCLILRHERTQVRMYGVCILKAMGASIGCLFVMLSLLFLIIGIVLAVQNGNEFSVPWVISWMESYVVGFFLNLMFQFNPFSIVLKLREAMDRPLFLYLSRIVGLGTWQAEREVALAAYKKNAGAVSSIRGDGFGALGQHDDDDDVAEDQCGGEIVAAAVGVHSVDVELAPVVADRLP